MSYNIDPKFGIPSDPIDHMPLIVTGDVQPIKQPPMHSFMGGFLTGAAIAEDVKEGLISIEPYDQANLNPNSYNLSIGDTMLECMGNDYLHNQYDENKLTYMIDLKKEIKYQEVKIPEDGIILKPGRLYLIATKEYIGSDYYIPMITGRSSLGRAGVSVHQEAGFGDIGYHGKWTLQVTVTLPTKIYPNMKMAQMYMVVPSGDTSIKYKGKYQNSNTAKGSEISKDF